MKRRSSIVTVPAVSFSPPIAFLSLGAVRLRTNRCWTNDTETLRALDNNGRYSYSDWFYGCRLHVVQPSDDSIYIPSNCRLRLERSDLIGHGAFAYVSFDRNCSNEAYLSQSINSLSSILFLLPFPIFCSFRVSGAFHFICLFP